MSHESVTPPMGKGAKKARRMAINGNIRSQELIWLDNAARGGRVGNTECPVLAESHNGKSNLD